jgi:hypothetical protein
MDESTHIIEAAVRVLADLQDKQPPLSSDLDILQNFLGAERESDPGLLVIVAIHKALERRQRQKVKKAGA